MKNRVHNSPNLIYSVGTQVVALKHVQGTDGQTVHPAGAVGVVIRSPQDRSHSYRIRFMDGFEMGNRASEQLLTLSTADKNELLFSRGVNFNDLPLWQKRGIGLVWENYAKEAVNQKSGEAVMATRRRIQRIEELPKGDKYSQFIRRLTPEKASC